MSNPEEKKTLFLYNEAIHKKIEVTEILDSNGDPTGHYQRQVNEGDEFFETASVWGEYFDNRNNYSEFPNILNEFIKGPQLLNGMDYNYIFTDRKSRNFLISYATNFSKTPIHQNSTLYYVLLDICFKLGYVNSEPKVVTDPDTNIPMMVFKITEKDNPLISYDMYLIPMDNYCYKFDTLSLEM